MCILHQIKTIFKSYLKLFTCQLNKKNTNFTKRAHGCFHVLKRKLNYDDIKNQKRLNEAWFYDNGGLIYRTQFAAFSTFAADRSVLSDTASGIFQFHGR